MSTNINISVGDNKLLEQARQQQAASRQAQLEKEATKRLEAQATAERTSALAAAGKDANGNPLYGISTPAPSIDRRPAANRFGLPGVLLVPTNGYSSYGGTLSGIRGRSQGPGPVFARLSLSTWSRPTVDNGTPPVFSWGRNFPEFTYLPNGGPDGKGALELTPNNTNTGTVRYNAFVADPLSPVPGEQFYYYRSFDPLPGTIYYDEYTPYPFGSVTNAHSMQSLVYALTKNTYDTIPDWQGSTNATDPFLPSTPQPPYQLLNLNNNLVSAEPKYKWIDVPNFTQEFFVRCGNGNHEAGRAYRTQGNNTPNFSPVMRGGEVLLSFAGVTIRFTYSENLAATNPELPAWVVTDNSVIVAGNPLIISIRDYTFLTKLFTGIVPYALNSLTFTTTGDPSTRPPANHFLVNDQEWVHVAVVKRQVSGQPRWFIYQNGKNIYPDQTITEKPTWVDTYGQQPISARISAYCFNGPFSPPAPFLPAIHGYRFTPKARYTEDFTPPTSITSLS